jgi:CubicO group peptidase (beta-lactamase class C family)
VIDVAVAEVFTGDGDMKKIVNGWAGLIMVFLILGGCASVPARPQTLVPGDYSYLQEYMSWLIQKEMKKNEVTGLSIALVDDQKVVWAEGFGFADQGDQIRATPYTVYRAGSISKLFTATAVMQLAEQGKMDIDQPLQSYLPEFSIKSRFTSADPITPRSLMTHHSGLPPELLKGMWNKKTEPFEGEVKELAEYYAAYPPNFVFSYSNVGISLLGHALGNVAGRDFSSQLQTSLLKPLGMLHSKFSSPPDGSPLGSKAYRKGVEAQELPLRDVPAGGLNSCVVDLSRFMQMIFAKGRSGDHQIVKAETLDEMLRPQNTKVPLDLDFRIGLGWMLNPFGGIDAKLAGPVAHHNGATLYHRSQLIMLPEQKLGVVVLSNSATAGSVVSKVATETLKLALEAKTGLKQPEPKKQPTGEGDLSQEALQSYVGRYATLAGVVEVGKTSNHLTARFMNRSLRLVPRADGLFGLQYKLLGLFPISLGELDDDGFSTDKVSGRQILKVRSRGQEFLVGERIQLAPASDKWSQRTGDYEVANGGNDAVPFDKVSLRQDAGLLIVEYALPLFFDGKMSIALAPISDSEALTYGLGRGMGETIRVVKRDGEELLQYSGYLLRKKAR